MYPVGVTAIWLVWAVLILWLGILTFFIWQSSQKAFKSKKILDSIFTGEEEKVKLDQLIRKITGLGNQVDDIKEKINELSEDGLAHIQKIELMRYNPYEDTGGDQSFTIVLLDNKGSGVVITSLHSRAGTRVFAKPVTEGKPEKYEFSKEEEQVIEKALKI